MTQKDVFVEGARITISQAFTQVIQQLASVVKGTDPGWSLNTRVIIDGRKPLDEPQIPGYHGVTGMIYQTSGKKAQSTLEISR